MNSVIDAHLVKCSCEAEENEKKIELVCELIEDFKNTIDHAIILVKDENRTLSLANSLENKDLSIITFTAKNDIEDELKEFESGRNVIACCTFDVFQTISVDLAIHYILFNFPAKVRNIGRMLDSINKRMTGKQRIQIDFVTSELDNCDCFAALNMEMNMRGNESPSWLSEKIQSSFIQRKRASDEGSKTMKDVPVDPSCTHTKNEAPRFQRKRLRSPDVDIYNIPRGENGKFLIPSKLLRLADPKEESDEEEEEAIDDDYNSEDDIPSDWYNMFY